VQRQREQLVAAAVHVAARGRDAREKREKERAGPGILTYVHRADRSADEHKRASLRGGCDALCSSSTRRT
jgi:hypothetical protein